MSTVGQRVAHIADLMSCFAWDRSAQETCLQTWDISRPYLYQLAKEASRKVSADINEPDFVSAMVAQSLKRSLDAAEAAGDFRSVASLAMAWQKIAGPRTLDPGLARSEIPDNDPESAPGDSR